MLLALAPMKLLLLPWILVCMRFLCVRPLRVVKPCWPSKPNALGACLPRALQDLWVREPDVGLRSPLWEKLCNISILQFVGHSPWGLNYITNPLLPILLWFLVYFFVYLFIFFMSLVVKDLFW